MTFLWVIVWWIADNPGLEFSEDVNGWATWLIVCISLDLVGGVARS